MESYHKKHYRYDGTHLYRERLWKVSKTQHPYFSVAHSPRIIVVSEIRQRYGNDAITGRVTQSRQTITNKQMNLTLLHCSCFLLCWKEPTLHWFNVWINVEFRLILIRVGTVVPLYLGVFEWVPLYRYTIQYTTSHIYSWCVYLLFFSIFFIILILMVQRYNGTWSWQSLFTASPYHVVNIFDSFFCNHRYGVVPQKTLSVRWYKIVHRERLWKIVSKTHETLTDLPVQSTTRSTKWTAGSFLNHHFVLWLPSAAQYMHLMLNPGWSDELKDLD
jgi:hypothetical protein